MRRQPAPAPVEDESPQVNDRVRLGYDVPDAGGQDLRSTFTTRVEDVRPGRGRLARFVVAAPSDSREAARPDPGTGCILSWTSRRGLWSMATEYEGGEAIGGVACWALDQVGGAVREQRRRYVRIEWCVPVAVIPTSPEGTSSYCDSSAPILGWTQNISEAGFAGVLDGPTLPPETPVRAVLGVADDPVEAQGRVLSTAPHDDGAVRIVVVFDEGVGVGDRLRPLLFDQQRAQRRLASA